MKKSLLFAFVLTCLVTTSVSVPAASAVLRSGSGRDHVSFGDSITIEEGETADDIVCAFCTVRLRGDVSGDIVTFFGSVDLADGRTISGDAVAFGTDVSLGNESKVAGDFVFFGGDLRRAPSAIIHGDNVLFEGKGWIVLALLPILIPICFIWLVIHLIRRNRYRFPAYPGGRRF